MNASPVCFVQRIGLLVSARRQSRVRDSRRFSAIVLGSRYTSAILLCARVPGQLTRALYFGITVNTFDRFLLWPVLFFCHLLVANLLAWHLLAQVDFGYALGYSVLDIGSHIEEFGPQNRYRPDFEKTDRDEHFRLFGAITDGIQSDGEGLAEIRYPLVDGTRATLLRPQEVVHLQDVARLIKHYYQAGSVAAVLLLGLLIYSFRCRRPPPKPTKILTIFGAVVVAGAIALWLIGSVRVFYWLHQYAFPKDNPWFFYYQDSLMTTLMKAPDLFGFIGLLLLALTAVIWSISGTFLSRALKRRSGRG